MKPAFLFLLFIAIVSRGYSQLIDYSHLSPDDKDIAVQAFSNVGPETKKWFAEAAKQHPAGAFDESWVRTKLKERFRQDEINKVGNLFLVMMDYQLILNREARRGRQISDNNKQLQESTTCGELSQRFWEATPSFKLCSLRSLMTIGFPLHTKI